jgi:hypothetical protein
MSDTPEQQEVEVGPDDNIIVSEHSQQQIDESETPPAGDDE